MENSLKSFSSREWNEIPLSKFSSPNNEITQGQQEVNTTGRTTPNQEYNTLTKFQKLKYILKKPLNQSLRCITIMNVLLILFILQGLFGLFSCRFYQFLLKLILQLYFF